MSGTGPVVVALGAGASRAYDLSPTGLTMPLARGIATRSASAFPNRFASIMVASQDPPSVPTSLIELSTQIILHKFNSPAWLKHVQKANAALDELTPARLAALGSGEAYVWSSKSTEDAFTRGAVKVRCRPRVTLHGGGTKTAVEEE